ncbi:hypothetical protein M011DRAFT_469410 [Sporormia fimetaria CBS 119925]|uniref:EamA domain-containing protein n=1 Tax=Sporormia fimetaria CBS 119925 TaxID=1340428 RepID=A0A6A6V524_9PLEO|nr:hypothetical protein M011DRAFT_469410 [Sporormia fimetaria CBS 119925]
MSAPVSTGHVKNTPVTEQTNDVDVELQHLSPRIVKPAAFPRSDALHVSFNGAIRAPSPNPSVISIDDLNNVRLGRDPDYLPAGDGTRYASTSPAPRPTSFSGRAVLFWNRNKGLGLVMIAQVFGTLMNVTTRLLEIEGNHGKGYHPSQIIFARMILTVFLASLYMWYTRTPHFPFGMREVRPLLVARGLCGFFGVFGIYYSLQYLPLADATVITFLAPSISCWACSFILHQPFTKMEQIAAYISLFGVVLIARPVSLFSSMRSETPPPATGADMVPPTSDTTGSHFADHYDNVTPAQRAAAVGVALLGVCGAAGAYTTLRWIGKRAHPLLSVNYFATWCTIVSTVLMFSIPGVGFLLPASFKDWCYLIFLGICGFVMQFLLAAGLAEEKSSRATNMVYTQMLFALSFDKLIWGTTPGWLSIIGSSLILGSAIYVAMHKENPATIVEERGRAREREEEVGLMRELGDEDVEEREGREGERI